MQKKLFERFYSSGMKTYQGNSSSYQEVFKYRVPDDVIRFRKFVFSFDVDENALIYSSLIIKIGMLHTEELSPKVSAWDYDYEHQPDVFLHPFDEALVLAKSNGTDNIRVTCALKGVEVVEV